MVVQHVAGVDGGGPISQLRLLHNTFLSEKYHLQIISQTRATGGINMGLIKELSAQMRTHAPDLVHVRGLLSGGFHALMAARMARCRRVLVSVHGISSDTTRHGLLLKLRQSVVSKILEPITLQRADAVYCVCEYAAQRKIIRRHAHNFMGVVHNGISIKPVPPRNLELREALRFKEDDTVALCVSRITRDKGLLVLARSLHLLEASGQKQPKVVIVGDGPDFALVERAFGRLISTGRVHMLGHRQDIPELHAASDFFVFPTLHENLSNALLEAMQSARAVLATAVGGNPELVQDGVTGILIPANCPEALAQGLSTMAGSSKLRDVFGAAGRIRVQEHFSIEKTARLLDQIYMRVLQGTQLNCE